MCILIKTLKIKAVINKLVFSCNLYAHIKLQYSIIFAVKCRMHFFTSIV